MPTYHVSSVGAASTDRPPKVFNARRAAQMRERAEMAARVSASVKRPIPSPPPGALPLPATSAATPAASNVGKENHEWSLASATTSGPAKPPVSAGSVQPAVKAVNARAESKKEKEEKPVAGPEAQTQTMAAPTFALTEAQKKQLESSLPLDSRGVSITDFHNKRIAIAYRCPHSTCENIIFVQTNDFNCRIFRCGVYKASGQPINPHASKADCDNLVRTGAIHGCGRPLRITEDDNAVICDYI